MVPHDFSQIELAFKEFGEDIEQYKEIFFSHIHILIQSEILDVIFKINLIDFLQPRADNKYQVLSKDLLKNGNIKKIIKATAPIYLDFYEKIKARNPKM